MQAIVETWLKENPSGAQGGLRCERNMLGAKKSSHNQFAGVGQWTESVHLSGKNCPSSRTDAASSRRRTHAAHTTRVTLNVQTEVRYRTLCLHDIHGPPLNTGKTSPRNVVPRTKVRSGFTKDFVTSFTTEPMLRALSLSAAMVVASAFAPSLPAGGMAQRTSAVSGEPGKAGGHTPCCATRTELQRCSSTRTELQSFLDAVGKQRRDRGSVQAGIPRRIFRACFPWSPAALGPARVRCSRQRRKRARLNCGDVRTQRV